MFAINALVVDGPLCLGGRNSRNLFILFQMFTTAISEIRHRKSAPLIRHGSDVNVSGENNPSAFRAYQSCRGLVCRTKRRLDPTPRNSSAARTPMNSSPAPCVLTSLTTIVAITDSEVSPLVSIADKTAFVSTGSQTFFHTLAPALAISQVLCGLLANRDRSASVEALTNADRYLQPLNIYSTTIPRRKI